MYSDVTVTFNDYHINRGASATVFILEGLASLALLESRSEHAAALFAWANFL
jgi:hypothetical protein